MEEKGTIHKDLLIRNGKIAEIGKNIEATEGMKLYDAEGLYVYPGFIDAHSHIGIAEEKVTPINDASNEGTNPVTPCVRAIDAVNPMDNAFHNALAARRLGRMGGAAGNNSGRRTHMPC